MTVILVVLFFTIVILMNLAHRRICNSIETKRTNSNKPDIEHPSNLTMPPQGETQCDQPDRPPRIAA